MFLNFQTDKFPYLINNVQITIVSKLHIFEKNKFFISKQLNKLAKNPILWHLYLGYVSFFEVHVILLQGNFNNLNNDVMH